MRRACGARRELLAAVHELRALDLSDNRLTLGAARPALAPASLRRLALDGNPLGDLCPRGADALRRDGVSPLFRMQALQALGLARTGAVWLCADWRRDMRALARLDLRNNNISTLEVLLSSSLPNMRHFLYVGLPVTLARDLTA